MYAINHAATALVLKRKFREAPMVPLLVSVQLMEVLWIALHYLHVERIELVNHRIELGFLPFSHSIASGVLLALAVGLFVAGVLKKPSLGLALGLGVFSHLVLDLVMHEPDIALGPFAHSPRFGLGIYHFPALTFVVELAYGVVCWRVFRGSKALLASIVLLNLLDLPFIFARPMGAAMTVEQADFAMTSIIALQTLISWAVVWRFARTSAASPRPAAILAPASAS